MFDRVPTKRGEQVGEYVSIQRKKKKLRNTLLITGLAGTLNAYLTNFEENIITAGVDIKTMYQNSSAATIPAIPYPVLNPSFSPTRRNPSIGELSAAFAWAGILSGAFYYTFLNDTEKTYVRNSILNPLGIKFSKPVKNKSFVRLNADRLLISSLMN